MPICWSGDFAPYSVIGDVRWSDVATQVDVSVDAGAAQCIMSRYSCCTDVLRVLCLRVGVAYVATRVRDCCAPGGVYFAVNTKTSYFGLFAALTDAALFNEANALALGTIAAASTLRDKWRADERCCVCWVGGCVGLCRLVAVSVVAAFSVVLVCGRCVRRRWQAVAHAEAAGAGAVRRWMARRHAGVC